VLNTFAVGMMICLGERLIACAHTHTQTIIILYSIPYSWSMATSRAFVNYTHHANGRHAEHTSDIQAAINMVDMIKTEFENMVCVCVC
jgi:hypothetical protein